MRVEGPMLDPRRRLLLCEIELQCGFALRAYAASSGALARHDPEGFWHSLQALLQASAIIRRLLQADPVLRADLFIADDSPLLRPELALVADSRAAFLDWLAAHPRGPLRMTNFGPFGVSPADPSVFVRYLDPDRSIALVFGQPFDIPELLAATAALKEAAASQVHQLQAVV